MTSSVNPRPIEAQESTRGRSPTPWIFVLVALPLFALYLGTARTSLPYHNDALTNVLTAWSLGAKQTPILDEHQVLVEYRSYIGWVVESPRGPVSQYPPGAALLASPLYAIWTDAPVAELRNGNADAFGLDPVHVPLPSFWPAAVVAAAATALAMAFVSLSVAQLGFNARTAILTGYVGGLGTSAWTIASDSLWQHGPGMLWVALAGWLAATQRWLGAGLAFSMVILTRPPVALIGIALGVWLVLKRRRQPATALLIGAAPGAIALLSYNWWLYGKFTVSGGYGDVFTERALETDPAGFAENLWQAAVNPRYGLFVFTPLVLVLLVASLRASRHHHRWPVVMAIGGLLVLVLQLKANRASGGGDFLYYRYPLEPLTAAAPFLAVAWHEVWKVGVSARLVLVVAAAWSVGVHGYAVWLFR